MPYPRLYSCHLLIVCGLQRFNVVPIKQRNCTSTKSRVCSSIRQKRRIVINNRYRFGCGNTSIRCVGYVPTSPYTPAVAERVDADEQLQKVVQINGITRWVDLRPSKGKLLTAHARFESLPAGNLYKYVACLVTGQNNVTPNGVAFYYALKKGVLTKICAKCKVRYETWLNIGSIPKKIVRKIRLFTLIK